MSPMIWCFWSVSVVVVMVVVVVVMVVAIVSGFPRRILYTRIYRELIRTLFLLDFVVFVHECRVN